MNKRLVNVWIVLALALILGGCAYIPAVTDALNQNKNEYFLFKNKGEVADVSPVSLLPVSTKDFVSKGIIFVTSSVKLNPNGNVIDGSTVTFEMLMKEVQKLGADDFINLRIDEVHTISTSTGIIKKIVTDSSGNRVERETKSSTETPTEIEYKATALAIKYGNT
jgi:hypothetical protein